MLKKWKKLLFPFSMLLSLIFTYEGHPSEIIIKGTNMDKKLSQQKIIEHKIQHLTAAELKLAESLSFKGKTKDGRGIIFTLFDGTDAHIDDFESIVNHPKVYPTLRHKGKWWPELIGRTAKRYVNGVRSHLKLLEEGGFKYSTDLDLCWVATVDGKVAARGGLQEEDGDESQRIPPTTELYYAVHPDYQNQGIATQLAKGASQYFDTLNTGNPLRALIMDGNDASKMVLEKVGGFKDIGKTITIEKWENSKYIVFEKM